MITLQHRTLRFLIENSAAQYPNHPALSMIGGQTYSYADLHQKIKAISSALHERGIITGDRVAILGENRPEWGIAYFAITSMAAVAVPILPDFHQTEILHILRHSESKAIFVSQKYLAKIEENLPSNIITVIALDDFSVLPHANRTNILSNLLHQGEQEFLLLKEAALKMIGKIPNNVTPESLAVIVYTSGTTGHSKGVMLTHNNIVSDVIGTTHIVDLNHSDRLLSILPLAHTYECTLGLTTALAVGATIHYLDKLPTASALLPAMKQIKPTVMLSVPLVIEKIFKTRIHPQLNNSIVKRSIQKIQFLRKRLHKIAGKKLLATFGSKLRLFCIGGAPLAPDVELFLREACFPYAMGYGLTETSPLIAGTNSLLTKYRATGKALPETEIRIDTPDPDNGEGEIIVKGPTVMRGYYKDEERTASTFTSDGWFKTGDLGVIDNDGYLYIKGRSKNMILGSNGKNIYPEEIESIINEFDLVLESLVVEKNQQIVARIFLDYDKVEEILKDDESSESKTREGISGLLKVLKQQINGRLPSYSRISEILEQTEPFEKTATQKIKRHLYS
ncbi:MAG: AMP-binding protein [Bacteriovoracaceae bacterium]|nr:AMP-binding protein [Bacteroidota bacterium]